MTQMIDNTVMRDVWSAVRRDLANQMRCAVAHGTRVRVQQHVGTPVRIVETQVCHPTEDELRDSHDAQY
jgi:hypothetical protein